jgi:hypothetical protein
MEALKSTSTMNTKKKNRWRVTTEMNGITETKEVIEVENGFVIEISKYGNVTVDGKETYTDECKKYISTKNPLKDKTPVEEVSAPENIIKSLEKIFGDTSNEY